ncbi:MAG: alkA, partial [Phycisphaerales bacterium]|nr:alkA [Phycisphaerales bacterium]
SARPGLRVPGGWDGFEIAVRAVLGQQITLKAATQLACRVVSTVGTSVTDSIDIPGLTHVFPRPERFNADALAGLGIPKARAAALVGVAAVAGADVRLFDPRRDLDEAVAHLRNIPGVGEWTAHYIAMRALGESDAFPAGDVAVQRKLAVRGRRPSAAELLARAQRWRPWRAYAVLHLWTADETVPQTSLPKENYHALTA